MKRFRQSFRFRILALTILVSGTVLLAFGLAARYSLYLIKISTVEQSLRSMPFQEFPHPEHSRSWARFADATERVANRIFKGDVHLLVYGPEGKLYFESKFLPMEGLLDRLPESEGVLEPAPFAETDLSPEYWREDRGRRGGPRGFGPGEGPPPPEAVLKGKPPREFDANRPRSRGGDPSQRVRRIPPPELLTLMSRDGPIRFGVYRYDGYNVAMGVELSQVAQEMNHLGRAFLFSAPLALLVIAIGAWIIASRAISPIRTLTRAASGLSVRNLDERIESGNEDREFSELIRVFNGMLERLERSFNQATRFSADAAHELKTPLTILQGHLESALQEAPDDSDQQRRLGMLLEETQRLHGITRRLLLLAQADAGQISVTGKPTRVGSLLEELVEDFEMQAPQTRFDSEIDRDAEVSVDPSLLTQILQNLLSNAVKYNDEADPWISVALALDDSELRIDISNGGPGIPEESISRLFHRFSRVDSARNRGVDGFGLGLNLSREFARAQGGELSLVESSPGNTHFRLVLPVVE